MWLFKARRHHYIEAETDNEARDEACQVDDGGGVEAGQVLDGDRHQEDHGGEEQHEVEGRPHAPRGVAFLKRGHNVQFYPRVL